MHLTGEEAENRGCKGGYLDRLRRYADRLLHGEDGEERRVVVWLDHILHSSSTESLVEISALRTEPTQSNTNTT